MAAQEVNFGCTPQDVWAQLGAPGGITYKSVDTMVIHAGQDLATPASSGELTRDYFYNYYDRGLDILFDGQVKTKES